MSVEYNVTLVDWARFCALWQERQDSRSCALRTPSSIPRGWIAIEPISLRLCADA